MKVFSFFLRKVFFRRFLIPMVLLVMFMLANVITSTGMLFNIEMFDFLKLYETKTNKTDYIIEVPGNVVFEDKDGKKIRDFINDNYNYSLDLQVNAFTLPDNKIGTNAYLVNENYVNNNNFPLSKGEMFNFDYDVSQEIPILIGPALESRFPLNETFRIYFDPIEEEVTFKVVGVLEKDQRHLNYSYWGVVDYYNTQIIIPTNNILLSKIKDYHNINIIYSVLHEITSADVKDIKQYFKDNFSVLLNLKSVETRYLEQKSEMISNTMGMCVYIAIPLLLFLGISIWNNKTSLKLMLKDFTINMLFGLSYKQVRKIYYLYHLLLLTLSFIYPYYFFAKGNIDSWKDGMSSFSVYGTLYLTSEQWLALAFSFIIGIVVVIINVECLMHKIKKTPISLGVLDK